MPRRKAHCASYAQPIARRLSALFFRSSCAAASHILSSGTASSDETVCTDTPKTGVSTLTGGQRRLRAGCLALDAGFSGDGCADYNYCLGAGFGPVLTPDSQGSVQVIGRLVQGRVPGIPRLGFDVVDVRVLVTCTYVRCDRARSGG